MEYDIFRDELALKYPAYGHALWVPSPGGLYLSIQVGDVGFIREGKFIRLFNVLLPRDHPSHENFGVPEYHKPLQLKISKHIFPSKISPNNFCSKGVTILSDQHGINAIEPEPPQSVFSCSRRQGAILSLPVPAQREDTVARGDFAKCITKHIDVWFAFARDLGLGVTRMEDIILVTGRDLARSWTNVVFSENQGGEQVSFGVQVTGTSDVQWQVSLENVRGATVSNGPSGKSLPEDQCIFVRGFRVTRFLRIIPRLRGAAEPTLDLDQDEPESGHDKRVISTPCETDYKDPLRTLLNYLDQQSPECDMALVHDDDLRYISVTSLDNLRPNAVLGNLQNSRPEIWSTLCGLVPVSQSGSEARMPVAKVAMLSHYVFEPPSDKDTGGSSARATSVTLHNEIAPGVVTTLAQSAIRSIRTSFSSETLPHLVSHWNSDLSSHLSPESAVLPVPARSDGGGGPRLTHSSEYLPPTALGPPGNPIYSFPPSRHVDLLAQQRGVQLIHPPEVQLFSHGHYSDASSGSRDRGGPAWGAQHTSPDPLASLSDSPTCLPEFLPDLGLESGQTPLINMSRGDSDCSSDGPRGAPGDVAMNVIHITTTDASMKRRINDAKFQCPVPGCGSTFARHFNLKEHMRSHNDEKLFQCKWPGCGKGFARQHDCKRHEQLHSNHHPFTCDGCRKSFEGLDELNLHLGSEGDSDCVKAQKMNSDQQLAAMPMNVDPDASSRDEWSFIDGSMFV